MNYSFKKQRGVVLFIALIALVVMSLAAVALIRSVDTNTIIAGNLAFKQSATISADTGMESAIEWLSNNSASLAADSTASKALGYYSTSVPGLSLTTDATWTEANSARAGEAGCPATVSCISGLDANGTDESGNNIRYVIERMCRATGEPTPEACLFGTTADEGCIRVGDPACAGQPVLSPMYRVTVRVSGPQHTVSYTQAFIY
jgi:Tfp pilus assembly protein PilX